MQTYEIWHFRAADGVTYEKLLILLGDGGHRYVFGSATPMPLDTLQRDYILIGELKI
jgi:hypothetical protein